MDGVLLQAPGPLYLRAVCGHKRVSGEAGHIRSSHYLRGVRDVSPWPRLPMAVISLTLSGVVFLIWLSDVPPYSQFFLESPPKHTMKVKVAQLCPTLVTPMDYISIVHGILQARTLEWVAFPFSRRSSQPRDQI